MGKKYIIGDTGAGYAGKMLSMAAKKFGLKCKIFMGVKDMKRQKPNCDAIRKNGAEIVPVYSGSQTLVDAVSECMRYWVSNCDTTHMCVGSTVGPNIFVKICGWSTSQISRELKSQIKVQFGSMPKKLKLYNCVGGGSSSYGFWSDFMDLDKKQVEFIGVEAGGPKKSKKHAAPLTYGSRIGVLHGAMQYVNQDKIGQIEETESISAGLDYPGVSPLHCFLKDTKRARYTAASDEDALSAYKIVTKFEELRPSLEPSHAFSVAIKEAKKLKKDTIVVVNSCGDAYKDREILKKNDPLLFFIQRLRDEAHRFAISTHRAKRKKGLSKSLLDQIDGIGKQRKRSLLNHFGSARSVESASLEDLKSVEGIEESIAKKIYDYFHE